MKTCRICEKEKDFNEFHERKLKYGIGYRNECKECRCNIEKQRRQNNIEEFKKKDKEYYQKNKETHKKKSKEYTIKNHDKIILNKKYYYQKNKEKIRIYHLQNKTKRNSRIKLRRKEYPIFSIKESIRARIHEALNKKKISTSNLTLIGINNINLKKWIEYQFNDKMNWENYGSYWVIDHVIPVSFFNLINNFEKLICNNWTNLRPLEKKENIIKSNKILVDEILNHIKILNQISLLNTGYQAYLESSMWRRVELRYGKNSTDEENFKNLLKWAIRSQAPNF